MINNDDLIEKTLNDMPVLSPHGFSKGKLGDFLTEVSNKFMVNKIKAFPQWCRETQAVNARMRRHYYDHGHKGKYLMSDKEDSYGFSEDGTMYHKWIVPKELEFFMRNCIYRNFWDDDNKKVRDSFMKAILRGTKEPLQLLAEVRSHYGAHENGT